MYSTDLYYKKYLQNYSLKNLPGERWKEITGDEGYAISSYGRMKSLERWIRSGASHERKLPEIVMKIQVHKLYNKLIKREVFQLSGRISRDGKKRSVSLARLVYYHFVAPFDLDDKSLVVSPRDGNNLHIRAGNLELLNVFQQKQKAFRSKRMQSWRTPIKQAVTQYTVDGKFVKRYDSMQDAATALNISTGSLYEVVQGTYHTCKGFRWFRAEYKPTKKDFRHVTPNRVKTQGHPFNHTIWLKTGKPEFDLDSPPPHLNLSLKNLPGECWKPVPGYEEMYAVSNKGRGKRLAGWKSGSWQVSIGEQILGLGANLGRRGEVQVLGVRMQKNGIKRQVSIGRLVYHCFVKPFDLNDRKKLIVYKDGNLFNIVPENLELKEISTVLRAAKAK